MILQRATFVLVFLTLLAALAQWLHPFVPVGPSPFRPKTLEEPNSAASNTLPKETIASDETQTEDTAWTPGTPVPSHPHLVTSETEGQWVPAPGYEWVNQDDRDDYTVEWNPGSSHPQHENVIASDVADQWLPDAGYKWASDRRGPGDFRVVWSPGPVFSRYPNVIATENENEFEPAQGYEWVNSCDTNDLRTRRSKSAR